MNAYIDIFVSFHNKNYTHIVEHSTQAGIKGAHKDSMASNLKCFKTDHNKYTDAHFLPN